jgi:ADP-heptose:LPS heptosyltransferase
MKKLFAGPWIGEFGWELFAWQGYLRQLKIEKYDQIHIGCRPGHELLYMDFATSFEFYTPISKQTDMWHCRQEPVFNYDHIDKKVDILKPGNFLGKKQCYIQYFAQDQNKRFDLVFHARKTNKCGTGYRDWPIQNWKILKNSFKDLSVCSIGTKDAAMLVPGTTDCRGNDLRTLADILGSSRLLVGPSSGPMHFGSLCKIPHIVWSPKTGMIHNKIRYEKTWNPLNTEVIFVEGSWQPSVETIYKACQKII